MNYEFMIDSLNENMQLDFLQDSLDNIGINESVGDKLQAIKDAVLHFLSVIQEKVSHFIHWVKSKIKRDKSAKEVAQETKAAIGRASVKVVDLSNENIEYYTLHTNRTNYLLSAEMKAIDDVESISRIAVNNNMDEHFMKDKVEAIKSSHQKFMDEIDQLGLGRKNDDKVVQNGNGLLMKQKLGKVNSSSVDAFQKYIEEIQNACDSSEKCIQKFSNAVKVARTNISKINGNISNNWYVKECKVTCNQLVDQTRTVFNSITKSFKSIISQQDRLVSVLNRIKAAFSKEAK